MIVLSRSLTALVLLVLLAAPTLAYNSMIEQQPIFTSQPADIGPLYNGARGVLQCTASGTPIASYRWLKDGNELSNKSSPSAGALIINQVDRFKDVGTYQCIAENPLGSVLSNKALLSVAYMDQLKVTYPTEIRVRQGRASIIYLPKIFDSYPTPTIEWYAGGALIEPNAKFAITKDNHLVILRCEKSDEKAYYVEASNVHCGTKIRSKEIRLFVEQSGNGGGFDSSGDGYSDLGGGSSSGDDFFFPDSMLARTSSSSGQMDLEFVVKPTNTIAKLNDNLAKFDCIVNSRRIPLDQLEITWFKDAVMIDFARTKYHVSTRSLEIISVSDQDAGVYTCSARYSGALASFDQRAAPNALSINASARLDVLIKPTFRSQPESLIETDFGKTISLRCEGIANPTAAVAWYRNAKLIDLSNAPNLRIEENGAKLTIHNISLVDQAIYQCFLSNEAGQISASTLIKIVSFAPKFNERLLNYTAYTDSAIRLSCGRADGSPRPTIAWQKLGPAPNDFSDLYMSGGGGGGGSGEAGPIANSFVDEATGDLVIKSINFRHQGWYKCQASNVLGSITAQTFLHVKKKTEIIEPPMNISVIKGQTALFKCSVSKEDDVDVEIIWKFNDLILDFASDQFSYSNLKYFPNGTLLVAEAKNTDIGVYKCLVNSVSDASAGNDSKTAYLNVVELPYAPSNLNAYLYQPEKRTVNLTWTGSFDGNSPILKYIIQARMLASDSTAPALSDVAPGSGLGGGGSSSSGQDWFVIKDNIYETPYGFQPAQPSQLQAAPQQAQTHWTLINQLQPAVTYEFRVSAMNSIGEGMPSLASNNLTVPEETPSSAPRNVNAHPLSATAISVTWNAPVATSWNGRLKGYVLAYSLTYPNSTWKTVRLEESAVSASPLFTTAAANITDLIVWEIYQVKVAAFNSKGLGLFSDAVRVRTLEGIPIKAPINFRANAVNSTCVRVTWNAPPAQFVNGLIQGYKLQLLENNQAEKKQTHVIDLNRHGGRFESTSGGGVDAARAWSLQQQQQQRSQFSYQVCGLLKYTVYSLSILCFTNSGNGPATLPLQVQTLEDVPDEVNEIAFPNVYDTSVEIEWRPPMHPNGRILAYVVSYCPLSLLLEQNRSTTGSGALGGSGSLEAQFGALPTNKELRHLTVDAGQNNLTLRNLQASTEYLIGLRARTQAGDGALKVTQIKSGVPPELPEPPRAIVIRTVGQTWAQLEFIPGFNGKTLINRWIVEALELDDNSVRFYSTTANASSSTSGARWTRIFEKANSPNATSLRVENLQPYKNYSLRMFAQNVKGRSTPSLPTEIFQTLAAAPAVPPEYLAARLRSLTVNSTDPNSFAMLVKWAPLPTSKWNGIPLGYILAVDSCTNSNTGSSSFSSNGGRKIEIKYQKNSYLLTGLRVFSCYGVRIAAWNGVGVGPFSAPVFVNRTSEARPSRGPANVNLDPVNATAVRITWSRLDDAYANGLVVAYRVKYQIGESTSGANATQRPSASSRLQQERVCLHKFECTNDAATVANFCSTPRELLVSALNESARSFEVKVGGLHSFTSYQFEIEACTIAGCGVPSLPVSITTNEALASRPSCVSFPTVNLTSVLVRWKAPLFPNGQLIAYRVRYALSPNDREDARTGAGLFNHVEQHWNVVYASANSSRGVHSLTVKGLSKMNYYVFAISANNTSGLGWGEEARAMVYTIDEERRQRPEPPSPPSVSKSSIKSHELTLSWSAGADNYSPVRFYSIQMLELADSAIAPREDQWRTLVRHVDPAQNVQFKVRGVDDDGNYYLRPNGRTYLFRVSATNDVGSSAYSAPSQLVRTKRDVPRSELLDFETVLVSPSTLKLRWRERISASHFETDELTKFRLVHKQVNLSDSSLLQYAKTDNNNEFFIDYNRTSRVYQRLETETIVAHEYRMESSLAAKAIYDFRICPINAIGEGKCKSSQALLYTEDTLPLPNVEMLDAGESRAGLVGLIEQLATPFSVAALSSSELQVSWSRPSRLQVNGELFGFRVAYFACEMDSATIRRRATGAAGVDALVVEKDALNVTIKGLTPFTRYCVYMQLINQAGESSSPFQFEELMASKNSTAGNQQQMVSRRLFQMAETLQSIPGPPAKLVFTYVSYTFLNFSWLEPVDSNGPILTYELSYENLPNRGSGGANRNASGNDVFVTNSIKKAISADAAGNRTLFIRDLTPNTEYLFRVRCRTQVDWGPATEARVRTGPQRLDEPNLSNTNVRTPMTPSRPVFSNLNDSFALLEWKAYSSDSEYYMVEIKYLMLSSNESHDSGYEIFAFTKAVRLFINKDLEIRQPYCQFRVSALNVRSVSEPSAPTELVHAHSAKMMAEENMKLSGGQAFYLNWWFLIILALSVATVFIVFISLMCFRGRNKKFISKRMNTIKMMKLHNADSTDADLNNHRLVLGGTSGSMRMPDGLPGNYATNKPGGIMASTLSTKLLIDDAAASKDNLYGKGDTAAAAANYLTLGRSQMLESRLNTLEHPYRMQHGGSTLGRSSHHDLGPPLPPHHLMDSDNYKLNAYGTLKARMNNCPATMHVQPNDYYTSNQMLKKAGVELMRSEILDAQYNQYVASGASNYLVPSSNGGHVYHANPAMMEHMYQEQQQRAAGAMLVEAPLPQPPAFLDADKARFEAEIESQRDLRSFMRNNYTASTKVDRRVGNLYEKFENIPLSNSAAAVAAEQNCYQAEYTKYPVTQPYQPAYLEMSAAAARPEDSMLRAEALHKTIEPATMESNYFTNTIGNHKTTTSSVLTSAITSTAEAVSALASAASSAGTSAKAAAETTTTTAPATPEINFSGGRVIMNNVAGSRKPLAGFTSFV